MKMSGTRQLDAPQSEVWAKLNDVDVLKRCIPGCESLEKVGDNDLKSTVALKIGPMSVRFSGAVTLSDLKPPESYRISGKGQGGAAGFASGGANVRLEPKDGGTLLSYDVDATVGGKIAQLGARLIDATAANLSNQFFDRFAAEVQPATGSATAAPASAAAAAPATPPAPVAPAYSSTPAAAPAPSRPATSTIPVSAPATSGSGSRWLWLVIAALVLVGLYLAFRG